MKLFLLLQDADQINTDIRRELIDKLEEFATYNDSLEEVFENKEQIEVSKFYEKLPNFTPSGTRVVEERIYTDLLKKKASNIIQQ